MSKNEDAKQLGLISENDSDRLLQELYECRVDISASYPKPQAIISIKVENGEKKPLFTVGNFSVLQGAAKSFKSTSLLPIIYSFMNKGLIGPFVSEVFNDRSQVLYIDTEQSKETIASKVKKFSINAPMRVGKLSDDDRLQIFSVREKSKEDRLLMIDKYLETNNKVGLLILDGVRDFVFDVNSSVESQRVIDMLFRWVDKYPIHVVCVIHVNKTNGDSRGHIGAELTNRAESVIQIVKEDLEEQSTIAYVPTYTRELNPGPFVFEVSNELFFKFNTELTAIKTNKSKSIKKRDPNINDLVKVLESLDLLENTWSKEELNTLLCSNLPESVHSGKTKSGQLINSAIADKKLLPVDDKKHPRYRLAKPK